MPKVYFCQIAKFGEDILNHAQPSYYKWNIYNTAVLTLNFDRPWPLKS